MENEEPRERERGGVGPIARKVGDNLRQLRMERKLRLEDVAAELTRRGYPISVPMLSKIERGERNIDVDDLDTFALAFGTTPTGLLRDPNDAKLDRIIDEYTEHDNRVHWFQLRIEEAEEALEEWRGKARGLVSTDRELEARAREKYGDAFFNQVLGVKAPAKKKGK